MRKERLVPDSRIRRGFRLELASNQDLKIGKNKEDVLAGGNRVHARRQVCRSDGEWRVPAVV